jgi:hypothetical protein
MFLVFSLAWTGCGGGNSTPPTSPVPASVTLSPSTQVSLEIGKIQIFTSSTLSSTNTAVTTPISFVSSNTAVVTISASGVACAGSWDSLSNPQLCTPGAEGTAQITASAQGVNSPPTTIYVHQHIASVSIEPVSLSTDPDPSSPEGLAGCTSKGHIREFQAVARTRTGVDISATMGVPTWQLSTATVGTLTTNTTGTVTATGLLPNHAQVTASTPGTSPMFVTVGGTSSVPMNFLTCPVQQITLEADNTPVNSLAFSGTGSKTLTAVVVDTSGTTITGVPLTWSSSRTSSVTVSSGAVSGAHPGGATVIASCLPPTCNIGFQPSLPIYPINPVSVSVTGTSATTTVLVSTTECGTTDDCVTQIVGIDTTANAVSNTFPLTATPNSIVFNPAGTKAFVGTDKSLLSAKGLMTVDLSASPTTITNSNGVAGKVLTVSPDGNHVIVSDTADTVNQVFIFNTADSSNTAMPITGATAAAYSPDNLKLFIAAGNKLYISSTQDAIQTVTLAAPATGVSYLPGGMGAYLVGGDPAGLSFVATCGTQPATVTPITLAGTPLIRALPDGRSIFAVTPPTVELVETILPTPPFALAAGQSGCPAPRGSLPLSFVANDPMNHPETVPVDLGQGAFTPTQLIISEDGAVAYIFIENSPNVLVYDINNRITTSIQLANNANALQGALTTDGKKLYVAASDGAVHVLDTPTTSDTTQITLPQPLCTSADGTHTYTCRPNLVAIKP